MRKAFILILFLIALLSVLFYGYKYWQNQKDVSLWELVPANAIMVYENDQLVRSYNHLQTQTIWRALGDLPAIKTLNHHFKALDSLSGFEGNLEKLLKGNTSLISMHNVAKNELDFIFYLQLKSLNQKEIGINLIKEFKKNTDLKQSQRVYLGFELNEIKDANNKVFTYIIYKNCFIGSFTPYLVEDVLRTIEDTGIKKFEDEQKQLFTLTRLNEGQGSIYLNANKLSSLYKLVSSNNNNFSSLVLDQMATGMLLDIKLSDDQWMMNGFSVIDQSSAFLQTFLNQKGKEITVDYLVPNRTAWLQHYAFSDAALWYERLSNFNQTKDSAAYFGLVKEQNIFRINYRNFYQFLSGEIANSVLASIDVNNPERLLYLKTKDISEALGKFNQLAEDAAELNQDSLYWENFAEERIVQLQISEFPAKWLGRAFLGYEQVFYTALDEYIVISNSLQAMKSMLSDVEAENTWGKSLRQTKFLESILTESNVSLIVNMPRSFELLKANMNANWKKLFDQFPATFKSFEQMAFQFSNVDDKFYTQIDVQYRESPFKNQNQLFEKQWELTLDVPIHTKAYVVRNHNNNQYEVMVQDSTLAIHLIDSEGAIIWTDTLESKIVSDIYQIDFYKNNKLQYLFATEKRIHLIDRNGISIEDWPLQLAENVKVQNITVVDYDRSKNYRFMLTDEKGDIYLYDKFKNSLPAWNPNKIGGPLSSQSRHIRVRGKDFMVALQADGILHLFNRRAELIDGFPVKLGDRVNTNFFFETAGSIDNSAFVLINDGGELIKVGLNSEIVNKQQLYKPTAQTNFQLIEDGLKRTYIIIRQDMNRLSILNKDGILRFDKDYLTDEQLKVQYYNFGANNEIIAVTDEKQEFTYIYNATGDLVNYQPLNSSFPIAMLHFESENKFFVYKIYQNTISLVSFYQ